LGEKKSLDDEILEALSKENLVEFRVLHEEILSKADLTDFYKKLKML
jgi:hypothetical protein